MDFYRLIPAEVVCVFPVFSWVIWVIPFSFVCFEPRSTPGDVFKSSLVKVVVPAVVGARRMQNWRYSKNIIIGNINLLFYFLNMV